jgi:photosystem II stability/assembly factor-like uncharacterized protein
VPQLTRLGCEASRPPRSCGAVAAIASALILRLACFLLALTDGNAWAHDPSSYGGVFRSRNLGGTWLNADVGLFLNAALAVAADPRDPSHLLVGTDLGLIGSRNGGRSWTPQAPDLIFGAVFAVAFSADGERALCAAQSGVFRFAGGRWAPARAADGAIPARAIVAGTSNDRIYLLGSSRLFVSEDGGQTYVPVGGPSQSREMTALAVIGTAKILVAVIDGRVMTSQDGGRGWRDGGLEGEAVDTVAPDAYAPDRIWAASADRIHTSADLGATWRAVGRALPEPGTKVRGIAADESAMTLVVTTQRGTYRSENGGQTWVLKEDNLPIHLEAGPLARDPRDPRLIYAVYSLMPYSEVWRAANEGGNLLARIDPISLAGGISFCLLVLIGGGFLAFRLACARTARSPSAPR